MFPFVELSSPLLAELLPRPSQTIIGGRSRRDRLLSAERGGHLARGGGKDVQ